MSHCRILYMSVLICWQRARVLDQVLKCTKVYLKASPSGVPSIMCLAQKWGHWTPFSRMSQIPWRWSSTHGETWETYVETIYTDSEGQDKNVPASTEAGHRPANKEESEKPEEGPDWVATTRSQASTSCHLESSPETENKAKSTLLRGVTICRNVTTRDLWWHWGSQSVKYPYS